MTNINNPIREFLKKNNLVLAVRKSAADDSQELFVVTGNVQLAAELTTILNQQSVLNHSTPRIGWNPDEPVTVFITDEHKKVLALAGADRTVQVEPVSYAHRVTLGNGTTAVGGIAGGKSWLDASREKTGVVQRR
jgi:hypothetical protein